MYGKGLRRCDPARLSHRLHALAHPVARAAYLAGLRGQAQLEPCQRTNQGGSSTCHTHSLIAAAWCALNAAGSPPPFVGSPRQLASCVYAAQQRPAPVPGAQMASLKDNGADLQEDADALKAWGLAPIQAPTSDGRFSDVENDSGDFPEADPEQLTKAVQLDGEYAIPVDSNAPRVVAACLDAGVPVQVGTFVDTAFENLPASQIAQPANTSDPNGGGHALYISGYRTNAAGKLEFRVENSWGPGWCDNGACWASEEWLTACWEIFPVAVKLTGGAS